VLKQPLLVQFERLHPHKVTKWFRKRMLFGSKQPLGATAGPSAAFFAPSRAPHPARAPVLGWVKIVRCGEFMRWTPLAARGLALLLAACGARTNLLGPDGPDDGSGPGLDGSADEPSPPKASCAAASGQTVVLASNQDPRGLAIDDGYVYWLDGASGEARRVSKEGGATQTIAISDSFRADPETFTAVDDSDLYWSAGGLWRVAKSGGMPELLSNGADRASGPPGVAIDSVNVYWAGWRDSTLGAQGIWKQSKDPSGLVGRIPKTGSPMQTIATTQAAYVYASGLALDDTYVWWTDVGEDGDSTVSRTLKAGGATTTIASVSQEAVREVAVDSTCAYWGTEGFSASIGTIVAYGK